MTPPARRLPLTDRWRMRPTAGPIPAGIPPEISAQVPGTVHTDLLAAGLIPDPYADANETVLAWIGESDFAWSTTFDAPPAAHERIDLVAEGIDTVAEIVVNDDVVATPRNQHRSHRIDLRGVIRERGNRLEIAVTSALRAAREAESRLGALPHVGNALPYNAIRKAAYGFGWDWGPVLVTAGIGKPVSLHLWSAARLDTVVPVISIDDEGHATVAVRVTAELTGSARRVSVRGRVAGATAEATVRHDGIARLELKVRHPARWWPRGYGAQSTYPLEIELVADGAVVDTWRREIGFRTVELRTDRDEQGVGFELVVNGTPIWVKGANWIPDDCFLPRVTPERYRAGVRDAVDGGFNLLRVWGGGIYEDDALYAACDREGILVWQDFAFACAAYAEADELRAEVEAEAREHIARLAPHPSLVFWNGSNENVEGYYDWGWREQLGDDVAWGRGYYDELLPSLLAEIDPSRPYLPSSPFSPGDYSRPRDPDDGSVHSWEVWNRRDYIHYADSVPRFVAEFGYQGPPQWTTLADAIGDPEWPDSPGMLAHQKAEDGLGKIERGMAPHVPAPDDMDAWWYAAQLNQARALEFGVAHWRSHWPRTTGSIVWQLNDCWPVTSWALVDAARRRKPAWFALRRLNAERWAAIRVDGGSLRLALHADVDREWDARITITRRRLDGELLASVELTATVPARGRVSLELPPDVAVPASAPDELLVAEVSQAGRAVHWFVEDPDLRIPSLDLSARTERVPGGWVLELTAARLVKDLVIAADRVAPDAAADDQLITLLPGERARVTVTTAAEVDPAELLRFPVLQSVNTLAHPDAIRIRIDEHEGARA